MGTYRIIGGRPLCGELTLHGAKNSVLPILAATLAVGQTCVLHRCPDISDVNVAIAILRGLGCRVTREREDTLVVDTSCAHSCGIAPELMQQMRAAVIFLGALLARFGEAELSLPGGCRLGERPIDLHLRGLRFLGARIEQQGERFRCRAPLLRGGTFALPFPSVGATENLLLASLACEGEFVLCNAAREPEITDLMRFLRACGAELSGDDGSVLCVHGGTKLHGAEYTVMPDRMEAATYLLAAAATRGRILLRDGEPGHLRAVLDTLRRCGCTLREERSLMELSCKKLGAAGAVRTAPYDGFPTDAQAPMMAAMCTAEGVSVFEENIFSARFAHVPALQAMGADICAGTRCAVVRGVPRLYGAHVTATDLRGAAAMVIAALSAEGESLVEETRHTERGYADFAAYLRRCGAAITCEET